MIRIKGPRPGTRWRHFKGDYYTVIAVGRHTETWPYPHVIYCNDDMTALWIRPLIMWYQKLPSGTQRFTYVSDNKRRPLITKDFAVVFGKPLVRRLTRMLEEMRCTSTKA
jgi:hypothetical protein